MLENPTTCLLVDTGEVVRHVETINQAVVMLGQTEIRN
jgi:hypothetical protein